MAENTKNNEKQIKDPPASFHSKVWTHFGFYETDDGRTLDKEYAICKNCFAKVKYNSNTTNLQSHLVRYHGELLSGDKKGKPSQPAITTAFKARFPFGSPRAQTITKSIAEFICKDLRPYSVVENDGFRRMLATLEPRYEVPSRRHFTEKVIPALYAETRAKVEGALQSAKRVALTCDGWTSRATESFVTITAHFIDDHWDAQTYVLQTRVMYDSHTGAHMAEVLKKAADEWKLNDKDPAVVTDNAANMSVAVEITGYLHVRCFAHILNLAVQRALKLPNVARLLGRIRRICTFFHRSSPAAEALKRNQKILGLPHHKLIADVVVRWNSAYEMVSRFLEQQPAVTAALLSPEVRCLCYFVTVLYGKSVVCDVNDIQL